MTNNDKLTTGVLGSKFDLTDEESDYLTERKRTETVVRPPQELIDAHEYVVHIRGRGTHYVYTPEETTLDGEILTIPDADYEDFKSLLDCRCLASGGPPWFDLVIGAASVTLYRDGDESDRVVSIADYTIDDERSELHEPERVGDPGFDELVLDPLKLKLYDSDY